MRWPLRRVGFRKVIRERKLKLVNTPDTKWCVSYFTKLNGWCTNVYSQKHFADNFINEVMEVDQSIPTISYEMKPLAWVNCGWLQEKTGGNQ